MPTLKITGATYLNVIPLLIVCYLQSSCINYMLLFQASAVGQVLLKSSQVI